MIENHFENKMLDNKLAIASVSLGEHISHTLPRKIVAAADRGFSGIEITYPDLEAHAKNLSTSMVDAAWHIHYLCEEHDISIVAFASFQNFEGNKTALKDRLATAREWLAITRALGAEYMQMPAIYIRDINNDHDLMVRELRELADLASASEPVVKLAYENLGWSTHCFLWEHALQMVQDVGRDNFGLCLDSFHLCVALWADAFSSSGRQTDGDKKLQDSLQRFVRDCPVEKIFYIQLSDGEVMNPPYSTDHPWYDPNLEPGHVWSNEARPFPLERQYGGYMPVQAITQAFLVDKGFTGWVSLETFDRRMRKEENGPDANAERGMKAWQNLRRELIAAQ
jgi:sugar phosphate isomerase/epimerase